MTDTDDDLYAWVDCDVCEGTGAPHCLECNSNGWVYDKEHGGTMACPECYGEKCGKCDGEGYYQS